MQGSFGGGLDIKRGDDALLPTGITVGHAQDTEAGTGCTVILCPQGATGAVSVRGAAPATHETDLLDPCNTVDRIHGIMLSGGSAFGLESVSGAMQWLKEHDVGFSMAGVSVPIVCGASIFDLTVGKADTYPDKAMGYAACKIAGTRVSTGNVGAGTGASLGKLLGGVYSMKSGVGCASVQVDSLTVCAVVVVNALGNVYDRNTGQAIAGVIDPQDSASLMDAYQASLMMLGLPAAPVAQEPLGISPNTTIGCVLTNGILTKSQAAHAADMTHDGYARAIDPVHTGFDGDAVFLLSTALVPCSVDLIGILAARVMEEAIHNAVQSSVSAYGLSALCDLENKR